MGNFERSKYTLLALGIASLPISALAVPTTIDFGNLSFSSTGQSMWGEGGATQIDQSFFLGETWNVSSGNLGTIIGDVTEVVVEVPHLHLPSGWECHGFLCSSGHFHNPGGIHIHEVSLGDLDTRTGIEGELSTTGRAGFNFGVQMDSGSVDTMVDMAASLIAPGAGDVVVGEMFNLNPASSLAGGLLETNSPEFAAKMEAVLAMTAVATGQACFIGFGCAQGSETLVDFDQTIELLSFNDEDSPGQIKILDVLDPALFQFGEEINIPSAIPGGSFGGVTITVPDINTAGGATGASLISSGQDDLIKLGLDLDGLALAPLGLPGLGVSLDVGIFNLSGDLIDVDTGPVLTVKQDFEFTPTLWVDLAFDHPVRIDGIADPVTSFSSAWNSLPDMALLFAETIITPTFSLRGEFVSKTFLGVDGFFNIDVLKASLGISAFGLSLGLDEVGPLYNIALRDNLFDLPPIFNQTFNLGGFDSVLGASFLISAKVPEPRPLLLLGIGLLMLSVRARSRRRSADRAH